jgi:hypothetical protein
MSAAWSRISIVRGCSSPVLVQEERQRHAPAALAADAPVGPVGDHVAQPGLAVLGVEAGLLDGVQRHLAQRAGGALSLVNTPSPSSMRTNHCAAAR